MKRLTQQQFADAVGTTRQTIAEHCRKGIMDLSLGFDECLLRYCAHIRAIAAGRGADYGELDLTAERARLAKEQADRAEMENAIRRGEQVNVEAVQDLWTVVLTNVKARLLGIPTKAAPELDGTIQQKRAVLDAQIREALEELSTGPDAWRAESLRRLGIAATAESDGESMGGNGKVPKSRKQRGAGKVAKH
ncbi:MAG: hypothetical protein OES09_00105 [Gammaproteobacteria bacterium]|nr:hypothetical protein [Gammaproteobacteria bacterium]